MTGPPFPAIAPELVHVALPDLTLASGRAP